MLSSALIKARAREIGFDMCGIAPVGEFPELRFLTEWLERGYAGTMGYLPRTAARRADVCRVVPSARTVVVTATLYNVDRPYSVERATPGEAVISRYAWGDDYHDVISRRLDELLAWMRAEHGEPFDARASVDTGPVQERVYARHAGLGWIGKNTCLINEEHGSWFFLSEIITSLVLEPDAPALDACGTCALCLEACPTGALREPGVLDATRCISYLTIELKRAMPEELREGVGNHVFGCDICQDVCPYNQSAPLSKDPHWLPRPGLDAPRLADLWRDRDDQLSERVRGTPMTRPRLEGLRRNLAVAIANSDDAESAAALDDIEPAAAAGNGLAAASTHQPMVREHVEWARRKRRTRRPRT
jgi:epoxyqueuosine reductase